MGSGKSTTGKNLASKLGWPFEDLDKSIEEYTGKAIPEIFSHHGEEYFREVESDVLKSLISHKNAVIATGGGTPCYSDNMDFMLETGLTLYLKLTPRQLKSRLLISAGERPLIKNLNNEELLIFIKEKLAFREKWYNRAIITVEGFDPDINSLISIVRSGLNV